MLFKNRHNIKDKIFRAIALLITICYLAEPAQHPISNLLHFVSHNLKAPSYILQHDTDKAQLETAYKNRVTVVHQHQVIDFINDILGFSTEKDKHQSQTTLSSIGFKKTIVHYKYNFNIGVFLSPSKQDNFKIIKTLKHKGYSLQLYRPPQLLSIV